MKCRNCNQEVSEVMLDLGSAPLSNAYLSPIAMRRPEKWFPLRVLVCESCWLVQAEAYSRAAEIFNDEYAYYSSFSDSWLEHASTYQRQVTDEFGLNSKSLVVEIGSNDGYLLQYFQADGIPSLGVEPTASTAAAARLKGLEVVEDFFTTTLARTILANRGPADLVVGNNVLAHVPDPKELLNATHQLLKPNGVATFEFPHLVKLVLERQFDTIYHEHFSYLSLTAVNSIGRAAGLELFRVEELGTHGGSLRTYFQRSDTGKRPVEVSVMDLLLRETDLGVHSSSFYRGFQRAAETIKLDLLTFLTQARREGKVVVGYGAAAKGNTLLNFAGVRPDLLAFVVDRNPAKQGRFMPGSRIPILTEEHLRAARPDYILILPWNLRDEISTQLAYSREWGTRFVAAIPSLAVF